jgi:hypothetical protein
MSKTYRNVPTKHYKYHPFSQWKQIIEEHDWYVPRSRHWKCHLVSANDDVHKSIYDDKWTFNPERKRKIQNRGVR